ncbi:MAG: M56 family metallopeptidase [Planctomycetales bacterium]|nr:M56 family metallopeptidase [Planctomycetales bacterium]
MNLPLVSETVWRTVGWSLLHFLWVGALAGLAGGVLRMACRRAAPAVRYAASLATLAAIVLAAVACGAWVASRSSEDIVADAADFVAPVSAPAPPPVVIDLKDTPIVAVQPPATIDLATLGNGVGVGDDAPYAPAPDSVIWQAVPPAIDAARPSPAPSLGARGDLVAALLADLARRLDAIAPLLPWLWLAGALVTFAWLATGLTGTRRLRTASSPLVAGPVAAAANRMRAALKLSRQVAIAVSEQVAQPVLVGIVRPLILLPAAAASGWDVQQLELALAHELAHVRRWDNAVNLLQRVIESVLWFHPAVWLASRQIRHDREQCCDAAVVAATGRPEAYADLLVELAATLRRRQPASLAAASALGSHPLTTRVRRILNLEDEPMRVSRSTLGAIVVALTAAVVTALSLPLTPPATAEATVTAAVEPGEATSLVADDGPSDARAIERVYDRQTLNVPLLRTFLRGVSDENTLPASLVGHDFHWSETDFEFRIVARRSLHELVGKYFSSKDISADNGKLPFDDGTLHSEIKALLHASPLNPLTTEEYDFTAFDAAAGYEHAAANILEGLCNDPYGPQVEIQINWSEPKTRATITAPRGVHALLRLLVSAGSPPWAHLTERTPGTQELANLVAVEDADTGAENLTATSGSEPDDLAATTRPTTESGEAFEEPVRITVRTAKDVEQQLSAIDLRGFVVEFAPEVGGDLVDRYVTTLEAQGREFELNNDGDQVSLVVTPLAQPAALTNEPGSRDSSSAGATKNLVVVPPGNASDDEIAAFVADIRSQGYECQLHWRTTQTPDGEARTPLLIAAVPVQSHLKPVFETRHDGRYMRRTVRLVGLGIVVPGAANSELPAYRGEP